MQLIVCVDDDVFDFVPIIRCYTLADYVQEGLTPLIWHMFSDFLTCVTLGFPIDCSLLN